MQCAPRCGGWCGCCCGGRVDDGVNDRRSFCRGISGSRFFCRAFRLCFRRAFGNSFGTLSFFGAFYDFARFVCFLLYHFSISALFSGLTFFTDQGVNACERLLFPADVVDDFAHAEAIFVIGCSPPQR